MPGQRQAALLLHALGDADRDWILAQIVPAQANSLRGHLDELNALGIPADPVLARQAIALAGSDPLDVIAAASVEQLAQVLDGEPGWLVGAVLRLHAWPWAAQYSAQRAAAGLAAIAPAADQLPAAAAQRLLGHLAARLEAP